MAVALLLRLYTGKPLVVLSKVDNMSWWPSRGFFFDCVITEAVGGQPHPLMSPKTATRTRTEVRGICVRTRDYLCTIYAQYCMILLLYYLPNIQPSSDTWVDRGRCARPPQPPALARDTFAPSPTARRLIHHLHLHPITSIHTTTHHVRRPYRLICRRRCPAPRLLRLGQQRA